MRIFKLVGRLIDIAFIPVEITSDWLEYGKRVSDKEIEVLNRELTAELEATEVPPKT